MEKQEDILKVICEMLFSFGFRKLYTIVFFRTPFWNRKRFPIFFFELTFPGIQFDQYDRGSGLIVCLLLLEQYVPYFVFRLLFLNPLRSKYQ